MKGAYRFGKSLLASTRLATLLLIGSCALSSCSRSNSDKYEFQVEPTENEASGRVMEPRDVEKALAEGDEDSESSYEQDLASSESNEHSNDDYEEYGDDNEYVVKEQPPAEETYAAISDSETKNVVIETLQAKVVKNVVLEKPKAKPVQLAKPPTPKKVVKKAIQPKPERKLASTPKVVAKKTEIRPAAKKIKPNPVAKKIPPKNVTPKKVAKTIYEVTTVHIKGQLGPIYVTVRPKLARRTAASVSSGGSRFTTLGDDSVAKTTVQDGESLGIISLRLYGTSKKWQEIAEWNNLQAPFLIKVGQKLILFETPALDEEEGQRLQANQWRHQLGLEPVNQEEFKSIVRRKDEVLGRKKFLDPEETYAAEEKPEPEIKDEPFIKKVTTEDEVAEEAPVKVEIEEVAAIVPPMEETAKQPVKEPAKKEELAREPATTPTSGTQIDDLALIALPKKLTTKEKKIVQKTKSLLKENKLDKAFDALAEVKGPGQPSQEENTKTEPPVEASEDFVWLDGDTAALIYTSLSQAKTYPAKFDFSKKFRKKVSINDVEHRIGEDVACGRFPVSEDGKSTYRKDLAGKVEFQVRCLVTYAE